ncbi:MAG: ATP12 family protein [Tepidamorphaceae bacterium]|nr:ATPase [Rhodobiaceae bacterium]MCC0050061.1 ATPase [Rhodobiaceae bacterium]
MSGEKNPMQRAQELSRPQLPKRFYKQVAVERDGEGFCIKLDARVLKTPGRQTLRLPSEDLARLIADEWDAQAEEVNPASMPLTRLANTALDGVERVKAEVGKDIASYACSDLLCYRAEGPEALVAIQRETWDPLIAWFTRAHGMTLKLAEGVMPVEQDRAAADAIGEKLAALSALELAALHTLTTLSGSAVIALGVLDGEVDPDTAWTAAHVDEDWQICQWGEDAEAKARRAMRRGEFDAASRVLVSLRASA